MTGFSPLHETCDSLQEDIEKAQCVTATLDEHYCINDGKVVCLIKPCNIRFFKSERMFKNHVFKAHGLLSAHDRNNYSEMKRHVYNARRRKRAHGPQLSSWYYWEKVAMRSKWRSEKRIMRYSWKSTCYGFKMSF